LGAAACRETFIAGNAVRIAAGEMKRKLLEVASKVLGASLDNLVAEGSKVYVKGNADKSVSIARLATECYNKGEIIAGRKCYDDPSRPAMHGGAPTYGFGTHAIEVEVDKETARVKVLNCVAAHDVGKAINPMIVEGQIEGGVVQGLGYALSECLVWEKGVIKNPNLQDYKALYSNDIPPIIPIIVESNDCIGPYGAKGVAEMGAIPTAAAIANAIYDAVGVRIKSLPITPEKILKALEQKKTR